MQEVFKQDSRRSRRFWDNHDKSSAVFTLLKAYDKIIHYIYIMDKSYAAPIIIIVSLLLFGGILLFQPSVKQQKTVIEKKDKIEQPILPEVSEPVVSGEPDALRQKAATCDQVCRSSGYAQGYCGTWTENEDQTLTECAAGELPYRASGGAVISDCIDELDSDTKSGSICCCQTQLSPE